MDEVAVILLGFLLFNIFQQAESKYCPYRAEDGSTSYFTCAYYENCCGRSCCRSATLTFYQLWYFWLSVILILLLCSGGGWWYRFKYRGHIYTQPSAGSTNAFYCPQADRVMLQNIYKDFRYPPHLYSSTSSPFNSQANHQYACNTLSPMAMNAAPLSGVSVGPPPPPSYSELPPSYDSIFKQEKNNAAN